MFLVDFCPGEGTGVGDDVVEPEIAGEAPPGEATRGSGLVVRVTYLAVVGSKYENSHPGDSF
jgi:hypothetical protein